MEFNSVIITDATGMNGFCSYMSRELAVPSAIANGCDIFLFNFNVEEDFYSNQKVESMFIDDIVIYVLSEETSSNRTTVRLSWNVPLANYHNSYWQFYYYAWLGCFRRLKKCSILQDRCYNFTY